jgi:hypothetical protein
MLSMGQLADYLRRLLHDGFTFESHTWQAHCTLDRVEAAPDAVTITMYQNTTSLSHRIPMTSRILAMTDDMFQVRQSQTDYPKDDLIWTFRPAAPLEDA